MKDFKSFFEDEEGMGTVEIVLIIAALVSMALIFKNTFVDLIKKMIQTVASPAANVDVETNQVNVEVKPTK